MFVVNQVFLLSVSPVCLPKREEFQTPTQQQQEHYLRVLASFLIVVQVLD